MITTNTLPAASGKGRLITLWTLSGLVALAFVFVGGGKLAGTAAMVSASGSDISPVSWRWPAASDYWFRGTPSMRPSCFSSS